MYASRAGSVKNNFLILHFNTGSAEGITFIFDVATNLENYFQENEVDLIYSHLGLYHFPDSDDREKLVNHPLDVAVS